MASNGATANNLDIEFEWVNEPRYFVDKMRYTYLILNNCIHKEVRLLYSNYFQEFLYKSLEILLLMTMNVFQSFRYLNERLSSHLKNNPEMSLRQKLDLTKQSHDGNLVGRNENENVKLRVNSPIKYEVSTICRLFRNQIEFELLIYKLGTFGTFHFLCGCHKQKSDSSIHRDWYKCF